MNELYNAYMSNPTNRPPVQSVTTPIQRMNQVMQAMHNPMPVILQAFPDIPMYMRNDPNQMIQYLKQTRHISDQEIQNTMNQIPKF